MKKKNLNILYVGLGVALLIGIIFFFGLRQTTFSDTFIPVYCNDYSFTCCVEQVDRTETFSLNIYQGWKCPSDATKCVVTSASKDMYLGNLNCENKLGFRHPISYFPPIPGMYFHCDDDVKYNAPKDMRPGQWICSGGAYSGNFEVKIYKNNLIFTGRAGSTIGEPVNGADGCKFNPQATYDDSGRIVEYDISYDSYVVPEGQCVTTFLSGDRHICANLEEECNRDSDCDGHTYGTQECSARKLQTYGCKQLSLPSSLESYGSGYAFKPFEVTNEEYTADNLGDLSRCEVISVKSVECCGDNDCGTNAICDTSTFTCEIPSDVPCKRDYECGVSTTCDVKSLELRTPVCSGGECGYDSIDIECCSSNDCASGEFCDSEYKCLESKPGIQPCPYDCCLGEELYFNKPCSLDFFCVDNKCVTTGCKTDDDCSKDQICEDGNCKDDIDPLECKWYQDEVMEEKCGLSLLCHLGITKPKVVNSCKFSPMIFFTGLILGLAVIVFLFVYLKIKIGKLLTKSIK